MVKRIFIITIVLGLVIFFLPASIKYSITKYPRIVLLAPLNGINRFLSNIQLNKKEYQHFSELATKLSLENTRLKEQLLKTDQKPDLRKDDVISTEIIARDNEAGIRFFTIDKGSVENIKLNMPVLTADGLVGKVIEVTEYQSIIETALSPSLKISALDRRSRVVGVIEYSSLSNLRFKYTFAESNIQINDTIMTSGLGGIFPSGINIGIVKSVTTDPTRFFQYVDIKPIVNYNTIEQVFVLTSEFRPLQESATEIINEENLQNLKIRTPNNPRMRW